MKKVKIVKHKTGCCYVVKHKWLFWWFVDTFTSDNVIKGFNNIKKAKKYIKKNYKKCYLLIN